MPSSEMPVDKPKPKDMVLTQNTDDFIIGDRVWVNGTKPGYIQYLGETRFAPGDWAGVVLDDRSGKNNGTVAGVHYFQCEPKRGVFARLHKLTRYPVLGAKSSDTPPACLTPPPQVQRCLTPTRSTSPGLGGRLREGDRVLVASGGGASKSGVLRFLGQTDFATGEWAGVELDEPLGKNDGTVAGKRYFRCSSNHGLFSPLHKVSRSNDRPRGRDSPHSQRESDKESQRDDLTRASVHMQQVERDLSLVQEEHRKHVEESEKREHKLRHLLEAAEAERKKIAATLEHERRKVEELEFRVDEECITKDDLQLETKKERQRIDELERRLEEEMRKNKRIADGESKESVLEEELRLQRDVANTLRQDLKEKTLQATQPHRDRETEEKLRKKEESLLQMQLSLDNKKREVNSLQARIAEMEKELEKSKARQERQIGAIDDLNVKVQKTETRCASLVEELHLAKENEEELERRNGTFVERMEQLEREKCRLEEQARQILAPEGPSAGKEAALIENLNAQTEEMERLHEEIRRQQETARSLRDEKERQRAEHEMKIGPLKREHEELLRREKRRNAESEQELKDRIRDVERALEEARADSKRHGEHLQEAQIKMEALGELDNLRNRLDSMQATKDLLRVENEETAKRLQISEDDRRRWEAEAQRASLEVQALRAQVQRLGAEFSTHRQDLVKKLAETEFDAQLVQDLHAQIETQRHMVEEVQERLRRTEGQRDQLQTVLTTTQHDQGQLESSATNLRQEVETLKKRFFESESERQSLQIRLEATAQLLEQNAQKMDSQHYELSNALSEKKGLSDTERTQLENKIVELQRDLEAFKRRDSDYENLKAEKETFENQVDFMNSVIVDMQKKNDDLKSRLEILETEVIFDGQINLGATSRLFCDICDMFDLHDTEDCPKQASPSPFVKRRLSFSSQESEF